MACHRNLKGSMFFAGMGGEPNMFNASGFAIEITLRFPLDRDTMASVIVGHRFVSNPNAFWRG
jgi:hypothetical protein